MMHRKIGFAELATAVLDTLRRNTALPCYDAVPTDAPSPLLFAEVIGKRDASSKTMYKEIFTVQVHVVASPGDARTEIYQMIQQVEEALTEDIALPEPITLVLQTETGVQSMQKEATNEWHAVLSYDFTVSYGWKCKI